jgi:hypothetical protein
MLYSPDSSILCLASRASLRLLQLCSFYCLWGHKNVGCVLFFTSNIFYMCAVIYIVISGLCGGRAPRFIFALGPDVF